MIRIQVLQLFLPLIINNTDIEPSGMKIDHNNMIESCVDSH